MGRIIVVVGNHMTKIFKVRTFFRATPPIEIYNGLDLISSGTLNAMVSVFPVDIFRPNRVKVSS